MSPVGHRDYFLILVEMDIQVIQHMLAALRDAIQGCLLLIGKTFVGLKLFDISQGI